MKKYGLNEALEKKYFTEAEENNILDIKYNKREGYSVLSKKTNREYDLWAGKTLGGTANGELIFITYYDTDGDAIFVDFVAGDLNNVNADTLEMITDRIEIYEKYN